MDSTQKTSDAWRYAPALPTSSQRFGARERDRVRLSRMFADGDDRPARRPGGTAFQARSFPRPGALPTVLRSVDEITGIPQDLSARPPSVIWGLDWGRPEPVFASTQQPMGEQSGAAERGAPASVGRSPSVERPGRRSSGKQTVTTQTNGSKKTRSAQSRSTKVARQSASSPQTKKPSTAQLATPRTEVNASALSDGIDRTSDAVRLDAPVANPGVLGWSMVSRATRPSTRIKIERRKRAAAEKVATVQATPSRVVTGKAASLEGASAQAAAKETVARKAATTANAAKGPGAKQTMSRKTATAGTPPKSAVAATALEATRSAKPETDKASAAKRAVARKAKTADPSPTKKATAKKAAAKSAAAKAPQRKLSPKKPSTGEVRTPKPPAVTGAAARKAETAKPSSTTKAAAGKGSVKKTAASVKRAAAGKASVKRATADKATLQQPITGQPPTTRDASLPTSEGSPTTHPGTGVSGSNPSGSLDRGVPLTTSRGETVQRSPLEDVPRPTAESAGAPVVVPMRATPDLVESSRVPAREPGAPSASKVSPSASKVSPSASKVSPSASKVSPSASKVSPSASKVSRSSVPDNEVALGHRASPSPSRASRPDASDADVVIGRSGVPQSGTAATPPPPVLRSVVGEAHSQAAPLKRASSGAVTEPPMQRAISRGTGNSPGEAGSRNLQRAQRSPLRRADLVASLGVALIRPGATMPQGRRTQTASRPFDSVRRDPSRTSDRGRVRSMTSGRVPRGVHRSVPSVPRPAVFDSRAFRRLDGRAQRISSPSRLGELGAQIVAGAAVVRAATSASLVRATDTDTDIGSAGRAAEPTHPRARGVSTSLAVQGPRRGSTDHSASVQRLPVGGVAGFAGAMESSSSRPPKSGGGKQLREQPPAPREKPPKRTPAKTKQSVSSPRSPTKTIQRSTPDSITVQRAEIALADQGGALDDDESSSSAIDRIDEIVEAIEDRVLMEIERRGGRYMGSF